MREKSLKKYIKYIILSLNMIVLNACMHKQIKLRPYPIAIPQYYQEKNNTLNSNNIENKQTTIVPTTNNFTTPIKPINQISKENIKQTNPEIKKSESINFTQQNSIIKEEEKKEEYKEEIIWEEVIYIPSALQTTPVDEIEILSETKKEENNINSSKDNNKKDETVKTSLPKQTPIITKEETKLSPPKKQKVKVYKGDTLYSIAKKYNVKVYELADYNKLKAPFVLKQGQTIEIPPEEKPTISIPTYEIIENLNKEKSFIEEPLKDFIIVKKGDTIYSIAKQNNVPLKDIILRNKLTAPYILSIGDKIYIPNSAFHIVKPQETAYSISRLYNVNINSLVKLNKLKEPYTLAIGQKLLLPATNIDIKPKQIKYVIKDKETTKIVKTSPKEKSKELTQIKVAKKEKIQHKEEELISSSQLTEKQTLQKAKIEQIISKPQPLTSHRFLWPVNGRIISEYGIKNNGKRNDGINISAKLGTPIVASENGIVAYSGNELKGLGNLIIIKHDKDYMTIYAHNDSILVKKGQKVNRGDKIATIGKTGRVSIPQLHFEIRQKTDAINPKNILEKK